MVVGVVRVVRGEVLVQNPEPVRPGATRVGQPGVVVRWRRELRTVEPDRGRVELVGDLHVSIREREFHEYLEVRREHPAPLVRIGHQPGGHGQRLKARCNPSMTGKVPARRVPKALGRGRVCQAKRRRTAARRLLALPVRRRCA